MDKRRQQQKARYDYGIYFCLAAMVGAVVYAFVRLYGLDPRVGADIIVVNVVVFTLSAGIMVCTCRGRSATSSRKRCSGIDLVVAPSLSREHTYG